MIKVNRENCHIQLDGVAAQLHELAGCLYNIGNTQLADTLNDLCEKVNDSNEYLKPDENENQQAITQLEAEKRELMLQIIDLQQKVMKLMDK